MILFVVCSLKDCVSLTELMYCAPCGACRQFLYEFNDKCIILGLENGGHEIIEDSLDSLLPKAFGPNNLK